MVEFEKGKKIKVHGGQKLEIIEKLGEGGQGIVYKVLYADRQMALKWYFPNKLSDSRAFYDNLLNNIKQGAPNKSFLWPQMITEWYDGSFGYLDQCHVSLLPVYGIGYGRAVVL